MDVKIFSFFSGLGCLDLGFEKTGFEISFVNEYNDDFLRAYKHVRRYKNIAPIYGYSNRDIRDYLLDEIWQWTFPDYYYRNNRLIGFIGGPPCPDFSAAGKNAGENGINGQLTSVYVNLIIKRLPDFFLLENVKGLCQFLKHKAFYELIKKKLYRSGYSLYDSLENALEYGVPQYRDRLILIGLKDDTFGKNIDFKIGNHKIYDMKLIKSMDWPSTNKFVENSYIEEPKNIIVPLTVEYWFRKNEVANHPNSNDIFKVKNIGKFVNIPEGDTKGKSFKRLHRWRYSPTAAYGNNEVHLHPYFPRRISVAESLSIQSLPKDFILPADLSISSKFKMVGNGVPYLLALGIAKDLKDLLQKFFQI